MFPFDVVGPRCFGSRCEDLEIEVTPTQLPQEWSRPWEAVENSLDLERGETAEVQVPREPGVRRFGEVIAVLAVAGDRSGSPDRKPCRSGVLAPLADGRREWRGVRGAAADRVLAPRAAGAGGGERDGWGEALPARGGEPPPVKGREHAVVVAAGRRDDPRGHDREAGTPAHLDGLCPAAVIEASEPSLGIRCHVVAQVDRPGTGLRNEPEDLVDPVTFTHLEPRADAAEGKRRGPQGIPKGSGSEADASARLTAMRRRG